MLERDRKPSKNRVATICQFQGRQIQRQLNALKKRWQNEKGKMRASQICLHWNSNKR